jgi:hypothetical protein
VVTLLLRFEPAICLDLVGTLVTGLGSNDDSEAALFGGVTEESGVLGVFDSMAAGGSEKDASMGDARSAGFACISDEATGVSRPFEAMMDGGRSASAVVRIFGVSCVGDARLRRGWLMLENSYIGARSH